MLVKVKVQKKTYKLGGVWGVRTVVKVVRWDDESKGERAAWPYIAVTGWEAHDHCLSGGDWIKDGVCAVFRIRGH